MKNYQIINFNDDEYDDFDIENDYEDDFIDLARDYSSLDDESDWINKK